MNGHVRKRGSKWEVLLELGEQAAQRCPVCMAKRGRNGGRLLWVEDDRHETCPQCGGALEDVTARRQIVLPERFRLKTEAEARLTREKQAGADGAFVEPSALTVGQFLQGEWLESLEAEGLTKNTILAYKVHVKQRIVPQLGAIALQKLSQRDVTRFATHMASEPGTRGRVLSAGTRHQALVVLHKALGAAVHAGYILSLIHI